MGSRREEGAELASSSCSCVMFCTCSAAASVVTTTCSTVAVGCFSISWPIEAASFAVALVALGDASSAASSSARVLFASAWSMVTSSATLPLRRVSARRHEGA